MSGSRAAKRNTKSSASGEFGDWATDLECVVLTILMHKKQSGPMLREAVEKKAGKRTSVAFYQLMTRLVSQGHVVVRDFEDDHRGIKVRGREYEVTELGIESFLMKVKSVIAANPIAMQAAKEALEAVKQDAG